jgi:16S rRNA (guanine(966)-N(2))-methyltransferase RsmD
MRVITGTLKGRHFDVPRSFKARPTTDFAKENLFNVVRAYIDFEDDCEALDLFTGTGSISLELVSRGCKRVISVEKEPLHYTFINKIAKELKAEQWLPLRGDVFKYITRCGEKFDFVFADPPYALEWLADLPDMIFSDSRLPMLNADGLFVLEHGKTYDFSSHPHFVEHRNYGSVNFTFFQ